MAKKSTKKALLASVLSLTLSASMFVGTTFAWFTDEVESGVNTIVSGNLDVELTHKGAGDTAFTTVEGATNLFKNANGGAMLWEPNASSTETFKVSNEGSLALKYNFSIVFANATATPEGKTLADVLTISVTDPNKTGTDAELQSGLLSDFTYSSSLTAMSTQEFNVTIAWPQGANDNAFNVKGGLKIDLGVKVVASQLTYETDGEDNQYDVNAPWTGAVDTAWYNDTDTAFEIKSAEELAGFAELVNNGNNFAGKTLTVVNDLDLNNMPWTPIADPNEDGWNDFKGTFDGNGQMIYNLSIDNPNGWGLGLFGYITSKAVIKNVKIHNVDINGEGPLGAVAGYAYFGTFENNHVTGKVEIVGTEHVGGIVGNGYYANFSGCSVVAEPGSYVKATVNSFAAGIVGYHGEGALKIENCVVKNLDITAYSAIGAITGIAQYNNIINGCEVENVNLYKTRLDGLASLGLACGTWTAKAGGKDYLTTITNNSFKNVTLNGTGTVMGDNLYGTNYSGLTVAIKLDDSGNTYENITRTVEPVKAVKTAAELETTIANAVDGDVIVFSNDIVGEIVAVQKPNVDVIINGNGYKFKGQFAIDGQYNSTNLETMTIKNVAFESDLEKDIIETKKVPAAASGGQWTYAHNVTFDNCTFTALGKAVRTYKALNLYQSYNITIKNCKAYNVHSLLGSTGSQGVKVDNVQLYNTKNGLFFTGASKNNVINNVTIETAGGTYSYGIRMDFDGTDARDWKITNCKISAAAPILVRKATGSASYTLVLENNTLTAGASGYQVIVTATDYDEGKTMTAPTCNYILTGADGYTVFNG